MCPNLLWVHSRSVGLKSILYIELVTECGATHKWGGGV